jgi:hypothetical protein
MVSFIKSYDHKYKGKQRVKGKFATRDAIKFGASHIVTLVIAIIPIISLADMMPPRLLMLSGAGGSK